MGGGKEIAARINLAIDKKGKTLYTESERENGGQTARGQNPAARCQMKLSLGSAGDLGG